MRTNGTAFVALLGLSLRFSANSEYQAQPATAVSANQPMQTLVGLWGSQKSFGPMVRGELTIDGRGQEWRARIAGYEVPVEHPNDTRAKDAHTSSDQATGEIHFALLGEAGKFRGHLGANGSEIFGHWIQLAGVAFYS
jgi:hypothetical protein